MRFATIFRTYAARTSGLLCLVAALALASPGVRISRADQNFSYDPSLEPAAAAVPSQTATLPPPPAKAAAGPTCAAGERAPILPLRGMPLLMAERGSSVPELEQLNSLNGRGYNIGRSEPAGELRQLELEILRRHAH